jgi:hypothetical protein
MDASAKPFEYSGTMFPTSVASTGDNNNTGNNNTGTNNTGVTAAGEGTNAGNNTGNNNRTSASASSSVSSSVASKFRADAPEWSPSQLGGGKFNLKRHGLVTEPIRRW